MKPCEAVSKLGPQRELDSPMKTSGGQFLQWD